MVWWTVTIILSLLTVVEVYADYCGENIFCDAPYKCCEINKGCCYDSMLHSSRHFRLQIWNMWYFWFLIIFMMISCFGGCGYYRRRRLAMLTRTTNPPPLRPSAILEPIQRRSRSRNIEGNARNFNFFAYIGPGVSLPEPVSNLPPAYSEVIGQPVHYPFSKVELPPYPGNNKPEDGPFAFASPPPMLPHEACLPPPYSDHTYSSSQPPILLSGMSSQSVPFQGTIEQAPEMYTEQASNSTAARNTTAGSNH